MKSGSVIVDLAAQNGGNCEYTVPGEIYTTENGVKVIGYTDLPGRLPTQSSQLYGTNLVNLLKLLCKEKDGNITVDFDDVVIRGVTVIRDGEITRFKTTDSGFRSATGSTESRAPTNGTGKAGFAMAEICFDGFGHYSLWLDGRCRA